MKSVRIAVTQFAAAEDKASNLDACQRLIREASAQGAQIVCLQELCLSRYFCHREDPQNFDLAELVPGESTDFFCDIAKELGIVLLLPLFEKRAVGIYHNSAAVIDADGRFLGKYQKMHIPQDPGFEEKFYFTPGDVGYEAWETAFGKIGVLICWDQWYPEAARLTALQGANILFYPTAIGWYQKEPEATRRAQHHAWQTVQCGHAVANGCFLAAANRIGLEDETEFWGQSFIANPYGEVIACAPAVEESVLVADCDLTQLEDFRRIWPFFRDRRIQTYGDLTQRWLEKPSR